MGPLGGPYSPMGGKRDSEELVGVRTFRFAGSFAFLYGNLKEEIYMNLPEGYRASGKVARLHKCIYGLKQSAREWYELLAAHLRKLG